MDLKRKDSRRVNTRAPEGKQHIMTQQQVDYRKFVEGRTRRKATERLEGPHHETTTTTTTTTTRHVPC
jgi:hypothetical protein